MLNALCYKPEGREFQSRRNYIFFFNLPNPFSHTMTLGSTQSLTEMRTKKLRGGKRRPARKADDLTAICEPTALPFFTD
jgi:hypothetical protein